MTEIEILLIELRNGFSDIDCFECGAGGEMEWYEVAVLSGRLQGGELNYGSRLLLCHSRFSLCTGYKQLV